MSTTTYVVTDGPLVANRERPDGSWYNGGTVPTGTELTMTGEKYTVPSGRLFLKGASPYLASKGETAWFSSDHISVKGTRTAGTSPRAIREAAAGRWFAGVAGRGLDVDNVPYYQPKQCVDVSKHFAIYEYGAPFGAYGDGKDVAANFARRLPAFVLMDPAKTLVQALDVLSWRDPYGVAYEKQADGSKKRVVYGHTAVAIKDEVTRGRLEVAQQDGFNKDTVVKRAVLDRDGLVAIARPVYVAGQAPTGATTVQTHTIVAGDSFWSIGIRYGVKPAVLQTLNPSMDPAALPIGGKVRVA